MDYSEGKIGRIFIIRLHDGDHLPDALESFAITKNLKSALCFLLGGVKGGGKIVVGPFDDNAMPPSPLVRILKNTHEVLGIGTLFVDQTGNPKLHMHACFGRKSNVVTGCIRMGIDIWQIGEIIILEIAEATAQRVKDQKTGFEFLEI